MIISLFVNRLKLVFSTELSCSGWTWINISSRKLVIDTQYFRGFHQTLFSVVLFLGHDHFYLSPFQSIIQQLSYHSVLQSLSNWQHGYINHVSKQINFSCLSFQRNMILILADTANPEALGYLFNSHGKCSTITMLHHVLGRFLHKLQTFQ
jgi:hypothetical protein